MRRLLLLLALAALAAGCGGIQIPTTPPPGPICTSADQCGCYTPVGSTWVERKCPDPPPPTCNGMVCPEGQHCVLKTEPAEAVCVPNEPPPNPCKDFPCANGTRCEVEDDKPICVPIDCPPAPPACECGTTGKKTPPDACGKRYPICKPCEPPNPPPGGCSGYTPVATGWSLLGCNPGCPGGQGVKCDCNGDGCSFDVKLGAVCNGDSTPRYHGSLPNWKTCDCANPDDGVPCEEWPTCEGGKVERSEYPPRPASGWDCNATSVWSAPPQVKIEPEGDGFGAKIRFTTEGKFPIKVCRKGSDSLCTTKFARVK